MLSAGATPTLVPRCSLATNRHQQPTGGGTPCDRSQFSVRDRFVYSNYFVPVRLTFDDDATPILPFYTKQQLIELGRYGGLDNDRLRRLLDELDMREVWQANEMDQATRSLPYTDPTSPPARPPAARASLLGDQHMEFVAGLLTSDLGVAFLDRTRIRPVGFALGEHVASPTNCPNSRPRASTPRRRSTAWPTGTS